VFDPAVHTSKSNPDKLRVSVTRGKEPGKKVTWGDKKQPFDAKKMVTDLSTKQFQQVSKWLHKVNTISGSSAKTEAESDTEGAISEAESVTSTPKSQKPKKPRHPRKTPPKKKTEETSALTKSTVKVRKLNNEVHLQKRLEDAMAKVRGCGRKGNIIGALTVVDGSDSASSDSDKHAAPTPKSTAGRWNGTVLADSSDDYDEFDENSDTTHHSMEMFCFADEFDGATAPNLPKLPLGASLTSNVEVSAMVAEVLAETPQVSTVESGKLGGCTSAPASGQLYDAPHPDDSSLPDFRPYTPPIGFNPYVPLVADPILSVQRVYTKRPFVPTDHRVHLEVMDDNSDEEMVQQVVSSSRTCQPLVDTGASTTLLTHNDTSPIISMLVSKIVPHETRFIVFGGTDSGLKSLGWGWARFCLMCSYTGQMVVTLARVFVALDASSRFRCIYAPGSVTPGGWD
jgi:hypothetical protein